ncbi:MAG: transglutaminase domain protein [Anaerocolumna sp.]|nr:transglutaminase domain protein [Anaerocolumna sp.]
MNKSIIRAFTKRYLSNIKQEYSSTKSNMAAVNNTLLVFGFTAFIHSIIGFRVGNPFILITSVMIINLLYKWDKNKKRAITYIIIASIIVGLALGSSLLKISLLKDFKDWFQWITNYNSSKEYYVNAYGRFACILIEILMSVIFYLLHRQNKVRIITVVALIIGGILLSVNKIMVPNVTVAITIYYTMWVITENCGYHRKKTIQEVDNHLAATFLAPVCLILAVVVLILPSPEKPLSWSGVIRLFEKAQEGGSILLTKLEYFFDANGSIFSLSEAGYTEDESELGGAISSNNKTSMIISTRNKSTAEAYLTGSISDIYTGRGWKKNKDHLNVVSKIIDYDFYNLVIALAREKETGVDISNLIKQRELQIKFHNIRTRSIFIPIKTYGLNIKNTIEYEETPQGGLIFSKAKSSGMEYDLKFYEMNLENPLFETMLIKNKPYIKPRDETIHTILEEVFRYSDNNSNLINESIYRDLELIEEDIRVNYTKLPKDLPIRVKLLAEGLTKDANSDYEKLKIIEKFLNTFKYTTDIKKTPKGEDFVDYFLFQQKEGYCTYFASAMGVMARSLNIPTRYVEGFVLNYEDKTGNISYIIKSNNAHAWVEAYIYGVGWIPFEPTPGFYSKRYKAWKNYDSNSPNEGITPLIIPKVPDSYENYGLNNNENLDSKPNQVLRDRKFFVKGLVVISASFILCVLMFSLSYVFARRRYKIIYRKAEEKERFIMDFKKILRYLYLDGYKLSREDTMFAFTDRIGKHYNLKSLSFAELGMLFMKVRYGEKDLTKEELKSVSDLKSEYEIYLKEKMGFFQMFFHEFKFLHFYQ